MDRPGAGEEPVGGRGRVLSGAHPEARLAVAAGELARVGGAGVRVGAPVGRGEGDRIGHGAVPGRHNAVDRLPRLGMGDSGMAARRGDEPSARQGLEQHRGMMRLRGLTHVNVRVTLPRRHFAESMSAMPRQKSARSARLRPCVGGPDPGRQVNLELYFQGFITS